ncbi:MAG: hypothetical protein IPI35_01595 [Deltaproteobacteria bacterium]|nr:hypothetical protein [Deltaproteobacteria bacterium]
MRGQSGHWIVKLPMAGYPGLTRWEHTIMDWASAAAWMCPSTISARLLRCPMRFNTSWSLKKMCI